MSFSYRFGNERLLISFFFRVGKTIKTAMFQITVVHTVTARYQRGYGDAKSKRQNQG